LSDLVSLAKVYGTTGTPINKTELLLNVNATYTKLLSRINSLNASLLEQQAKIAKLETDLADLEVCKVQCNSTFVPYLDSTTETMNWVDMDYTSLSITLNITSHLVIMFSTEARTVYGQDSILVRVLIENATYSDIAFPWFVYLTPTVSEELPIGWNHRHILGYSSYSYNFNKPSLPPGTYTIKVQWRLQNTAPPIGTGYVHYRTLNVIALP
jgi:hypothetical protein